MTVTASDRDIARAVELLRDGECVAFPTETVYGLGALATDATAAARIFAIKRRPRFDPLIVHVADADTAATLTSKWTPTAEKLAQRFWPGPLTLVLGKAPQIPEIVTAELPTVAVRVPDHPIAQDLLRRTGAPVAAPSANPFGYVSPTTAQHVRDQLGDQVAAIVDGGPCRVGVESTIIDATCDTPRLLRPGGITCEAIEEVLGVELGTAQVGAQPTAPGQLLSHYAPRVPVRLVASPADLPADQRAGTALLSIGPCADQEGFAHREILSPSGDLVEAAARLFAALRELDALGVRYICAVEIPDTGLGRAIMDRLRRAAQVS